MSIFEYSERFNKEVIDLILSIQREEFGVNITAADQPDLAMISSFYQQGCGNFWIATDDDRVVGTIAIKDIGDCQVALRKMFVHPAYRGREKGVSQQLMDALVEWCVARNVNSIWLGTIDVMKAAHRFYEKNGFTRTDIGGLPPNFPVMKVDNVFYKRIFDKNS